MKKWFGNIKLEEQSEFQKDHLSNLTVRFNRWHDKQINLLTFLINLFFTLSIATLGFVIKNFKNAPFDKIICECYSLGKTISLILIFSIIAGTLALFMRVYDFRRTKDKINFQKLKYKVKEDLKYQSEKQWAEKECQDKIDKLDTTTECLGKLTWFLFYSQVTLFLISLILTVWNFE
jgi:uncharacterized membrane protein